MWTPLRLRGRAPYLARRLILGATIAGQFPQPALSLDFTKGVNDPRITYSGGVGGTVMNSAGQIVAASAPRYDYGNPRTNLAIWSTDLTNAVWTKQAGTLVADPGIGPNGLSGVFLFTEDTTNTAHQLYTHYASPSTTQNIAFSFYVKSAGVKKIEFGGNWILINIVVDLTTGTVTGSGAGVTVVANCGNGWWKISVVTTAPDTANRTYVIRHVNSAGVDIYQGDGVSGVYLCFPQIELANATTNYIPTGATAVTVADPLGLLVEEQRTNLLLQAGSINTTPWAGGTGVTLTAATAFLPNSAAQLLTTDGLSSSRNISQTIGTFSGSAETLSAYIEQPTTNGAVNTSFSIRDTTGLTHVLLGTINWVDGTTVVTSGSGTVTSHYIGRGPNGGSLYRLDLTATGTAGNGRMVIVYPTGTGTNSNAVIFHGAQYEVGSFATSVIPTTTAAVTRTADVASIPTAGWFNTVAGTFFAIIDTIYSGGAPGSVGICGLGSGQRFLYVSSTSTPIASYDGTTILQNAIVITDKARHKVAMSYDGTTRTLTSDGDPVVTAAQAAGFTTGATMAIGAFGVGNPAWDGHIKLLEYYRNSLASALPRLTH